MAADNLAETLRTLIDEELRRRQDTAPTRTYDQGFAEGHTRGQTEAYAAIADALHKFANSLTSKTALTPLAPPVAAPTYQPQVTEPSQPRELRSLPARKQRIRDYLASHPGARYRDLSSALGQYVATAVYALEKAGEVAKDENRGFWLKPDGAQPHAHDDANRRRSTG